MCKSRKRNKPAHTIGPRSSPEFRNRFLLSEAAKLFLNAGLNVLRSLVQIIVVNNITNWRPNRIASDGPPCVADCLRMAWTSPGYFLRRFFNHIKYKFLGNAPNEVIVTWVNRNMWAK